MDFDDRSRDPRRILDDIAMSLKVAPAAFSEPLSCDLGRTAEMMRLWLKITDAQDQEKVLTIVRTVASRACGDRLG